MPSHDRLLMDEIAKKNAEIERLKGEAGRWRKESEIWRNRYYKLRGLINQAVDEINQRMGPRPDEPA